MTIFRNVIANTGWALAGNVLPLIAGLFAAPFLISRIGLDRFGTLSLAWILIGYFSIFDLGLARALTQKVAAEVSHERFDTLSNFSSTGLAMIIALGAVAGLLLAGSTLFPSWWIDKFPPEMRTEARNSLLLIAAGTPIVLGTSGLRGILEGLQQFKLLSFIRVPAGTAMFLAPCFTALFSRRTDIAIAAMLVARVATFIAHLRPCQRSVRLDIRAISSPFAVRLIQFGSWVTASNIVGSFMGYVDRLIIGAGLSAKALAYYSTPYDAASRLLVFPAALTSALFPSLVHAHAQDAMAAAAIERKATWLTLLIVGLAAVIGEILADDVLRVWINADFSAHAAPVLRLLLPGFVFNALAQIPFSSLHSKGFARHAAYLHIAELPLYLVGLALLLKAYGISGAAMAWSLRAMLDWIGMSLTLRLLRDTAPIAP